MYKLPQVANIRVSDTVAALLLALLVVACRREPATFVVFEPTLDAADRVARQRHGGDLVVFVCNDSAPCRRVRSQLFGPTQVGRFIAANFAAVELPAESAAAQQALTRLHSPVHSPQIIIASDRLKDLRIYALRLERIREPRFLRQLQAIKKATTIEDYRRITARERGTPPLRPQPR